MLALYLVFLAPDAFTAKRTDRMDALYEPLVFTRHKLPLHALIIERQAWFSALDLGRLMGMFFEQRLVYRALA